jgi:hypothetical protein
LANAFLNLKITSAISPIQKAGIRKKVIKNDAVGSMSDKSMEIPTATAAMGIIAEIKNARNFFIIVKPPI